MRSFNRFDRRTTARPSRASDAPDGKCASCGRVRAARGRVAARTAGRLLRPRALVAAIALAVLALPQGALAATRVLTFEGLQNLEFVEQFYNGGTGSLGSSGANFGVGFGPDTLAGIDAEAGGSGNFANEPSPDTIAVFLTGPGVVMNVAAGFTTGFSFYYTSAGPGSGYSSTTKP